MTKKLLRWIRVTNAAGTGYEPQETCRSGCGPGCCLGICDKSMFGICAGGHVGRFAVAQFGHAVSHGPLYVITETVAAMASRRLKVDIATFVDDLLNARAVLAHGICEGLKGNCPVCMEAWEEAMKLMAELDKILNDC